MIQVSDKNLVILQTLIHNKLLPDSGNFVVDEKLLFQHRLAYANLGSGNARSELKARRYAGAGFLFLKQYRNIPAKNYKEGILYLIKNPAWPEYTKVGISVNPNKRLLSYQTHDPNRAFYIASYEFVIDRFEAEKEILKDYSNFKAEGEWLSDINAEHLIQDIRSRIQWIKE